MEETTLSSQHGTLFQARLVKLRNLFGWKAALLLGLVAVCAVTFFFVFLSLATTPQKTSLAGHETRRTSRTNPQEQVLLHDIVQEMIAEGKLTPYPPGSPEALQAKPASPITPDERIKLYERYVLELLN